MWRIVVAGVISGAAALSGCKSDKPAPTTQVGSPPGSNAGQVVPLVAQLVVTHQRQAKAENGAEPVVLTMTLVVSNVTSRTYEGDAPDAAVARFALTVNDEPLWTYPTSVPQVVTPVTVAPGQRATYVAKALIPDIRPYKGRLLQARGKFTPAGLTTTTVVPVN